MLYHICFVPARSDQKILNKIIIDLAERYECYPFIAHMTIYSKIPATKQQVIEAIKKSLIDIKPFKIEVDKLDYSDLFNKTLFIQLKNNQVLKKIYRLLDDNLHQYVDYSFNPHMSLIYKNNMTAETKKQIIASINVNQTIIFDRCIIVAAEKPIKKEKDVTSWRIVYQKKLK